MQIGSVWYSFGRIEFSVFCALLTIWHFLPFAIAVHLLNSIQENSEQAEPFHRRICVLTGAFLLPLCGIAAWITIQDVESVFEYIGVIIGLPFLQLVTLLLGIITLGPLVEISLPIRWKKIDNKKIDSDGPHARPTDH